MYFVVPINELFDYKPALVAIKLVIVVEREASLLLIIQIVYLINQDENLQDLIFDDLHNLMVCLRVVLKH